MKIWTNALIAGSLIAAAVTVKKVVRLRRGEHAVVPTENASLGTNDLLEEDAAAIAMESGIANVDPEPLSHVAGEGIDLERDVRAHQEIAEQRERLPRH